MRLIAGEAMSLEELAARVEALTPTDGHHPTVLERVHVFRSTGTVRRSPVLYESWLVVMLRGTKTLHHAGRELSFAAGQVLCVTPGAPVDCELRDGVDGPLVCIYVDVGTEALLEAAAAAGPPAEPRPRVALLDVYPLDARLFDVCSRLVDVLHNPRDAAVLGDAVVRELVYRAVQRGPREALLELGASRSGASILRAVRHLRSAYAEEVSVEQLARQVGMSVSSFHDHFRRITGHSPLQYVKAVRLDRARQILRGGQSSVGEAASGVGYRSPSQFSREYRRHFGVSPTADRPRVLG